MAPGGKDRAASLGFRHFSQIYQVPCQTFDIGVHFRVYFWIYRWIRSRIQIARFELDNLLVNPV
jgi:hypothetical protein